MSPSFLRRNSDPARRPTARRFGAALLLGPALVVPLAGCVPAAERAFDGAVFASRTGEDAAGPLEWIDDNPVYWQLEYVDGIYSAVVGAPCAPISAPVTLDEESIVVDMDSAAIAEVDCDERRADMDAWVQAFITAPLDYTLDGEVLVLTGSEGTLTFERIDR